MTVQPAFVLPPSQGVTPPPPAPAPGPQPPTMRMDVLVDKYRQLRDKMKEISDRQSAELKPYREALDQLNTMMLDHLNASGQSSANTPNGTAYKTTRTSYSIADPAEFRKWVERMNMPEMYENRVSKEALENYVNAGNPLPPGLKVSSDVTVNVRK